MRKMLCCSLFILLLAFSASAKSIKHYVFFGMDREKLKDATSFLELKGFDGAQITYSWRQLLTIADIIQFGKDYLGVDYIFWTIEEPYYSERLIPFMKSQQAKK